MDPCNHAGSLQSLWILAAPLLCHPPRCVEPRSGWGVQMKLPWLLVAEYLAAEHPCSPLRLASILTAPTPAAPTPAVVHPAYRFTHTDRQPLLAVLDAVVSCRHADGQPAPPKAQGRATPRLPTTCPADARLHRLLNGADVSFESTPPRWRALRGSRGVRRRRTRRARGRARTHVSPVAHQPL